MLSLSDCVEDLGRRSAVTLSIRINLDMRGIILHAPNRGITIMLTGLTVHLVAIR
jgi:hypothetical protein